MNDVEAQAELTRMFFGFSGCIAFFIVIYFFRALRVYLLGRRVSAVVVRVFRKQTGRGGAKFGYLVEYCDPLDGSMKTAREPEGLPFQEFHRGDRVTAFVNRRGDAAEILDWRRLALSLVIIGIVVLAMLISYHFLIGVKKS